MHSYVILAEWPFHIYLIANWFNCGESFENHYNFMVTAPPISVILEQTLIVKSDLPGNVSIEGTGCLPQEGVQSQ